MKTVDQMRRENLETLVREAEGINAFVKKTNKSDPQVRQWLNATPHCVTKKPRVIGHESAREIEEICGKLIGWMDHDWSGQNIREGYRVVNSLKMPLDVEAHDHSQQAFIQIEPSERWVRDNLGAIDINTLWIMESHDDSMRPTILRDDIVFLSSAVQSFDSDGIYVITLDDHVAIRQLIKDRNRIDIRPHNSVYNPQSVEAENSQRLRILGRVMKWWSLNS